MPFKDNKPLFRIPTPKSAQGKSQAGQPSRKPAPEFKFFPRLPLEIRLAIWELALPEPRVLGLRVHLTQNLNGIICDYEGNIGWYGCRRVCPHKITSVSFSFSDMTSSMKLMHNGRVARVPVALRVCRDSRYVAMKKYKLSFPVFFDAEYTKHKRTRGECVSAEKKTWFDFENDTLFLDMTKWDFSPTGPFRLLIRHCLSEVEKVRKVVIAGERTWTMPGGGDRFFQWFKSFMSLKEVEVWDTFDLAGIRGTRNAYSRSLPPEEIARMSIVLALRYAKERDAEWTAELPTVKVVRHFDFL